MLERIQRIFEEVTGCVDVTLTPQTRLDDPALCISSFALIQLICGIEDEFDVEIPNMAVRNMKTMADLADYLRQKAGKQP